MFLWNQDKPEKYTRPTVVEMSGIAGGENKFQAGPRAQLVG